MVIVRFHSMLRVVTNEHWVRLDANTVREILCVLSEKYGSEFTDRVLDDAGGLRWFINVYVNGRDIRDHGGLDTHVGEDDEVTVFPAVSGG